MKTALVTGSTKGIGLAIARLLLQNGYRVILNYAHDDAAAALLHASLEREYGTARFCIIKSDLSGMASLDHFAEEALQFAPNIDVLVLNAGITDRTGFAELTYEQWIRVMDVNLNIPFFITQRFSPAFNAGGAIVFIGALMGIHPHAISIPYGVSKAGVHFLVRQLVKEFADRRISVNAVSPGFVDTDWQKEKPSAQRSRIENKTAFGRFATPEEVASLCMSVISNPFINGAVIPVDGGYDYR